MNDDSKKLLKNRKKFLVAIFSRKSRFLLTNLPHIGKTQFDMIRISDLLEAIQLIKSPKKQIRKRGQSSKNLNLNDLLLQ